MDRPPVREMGKIEFAVVQGCVRVTLEDGQHHLHLANQSVQCGIVQTKINKNDGRAAVGENERVHRVYVRIQMVRRASRYENKVDTLKRRVLHLTKMNLGWEPGIPLTEVHIAHALVGDQLIEGNRVDNVRVVVLYSSTQHPISPRFVSYFPNSASVKFFGLLGIVKFSGLMGIASFPNEGRNVAEGITLTTSVGATVS